MGRHTGTVLGGDPQARVVRSHWSSDTNVGLPGVGTADWASEVADLTGSSIAQLRHASTFTDWDMSTTWSIAEGAAPPRQRVFASRFQAPDLDGDGLTDALDADADGDGVPNILDAFPLDAAESVDTDDDGLGNNVDPDIDGDGVPNATDIFPLDRDEWLDTDGDGLGDNGDPLPQTGNYVLVFLGNATAAECPYGGTASKSGLDLNADGDLQANEVERAQFNCEPQRFTIGGTVSGLPSNGSVAFSAYNVAGGEAIGLSSNGSFTFPSPIATSKEFSVSISQPQLINQAATRYCEPAMGSKWNGTVGQSAITSVGIACYEHRQVFTVAGGTGVLDLPFGAAVDAAGTIYVGDTNVASVVHAVTAQGAVSNVFGLDYARPRGVAVASNGDLYVTATNLNTILKYTKATGIRSTFASACSGTAFNTPIGIAIDSSSNLYVADSLNNRICKITPAGNATTFTTGLMNPNGVAVDSAGTVYVADTSNNCIRKVTPAGGVSTLAGIVTGVGDYLDGTGSGARFSLPRGIAVDAVGTVYVADTGNRRIRKISPAGVVTSLAGFDTNFVDGVGTAARFRYPTGVAVDPQGNLIVTDQDSNRVRKLVLIAGTNDVTTSDDLVTMFTGNANAMAQLSILKQGWNPAAYGPLPADPVIFDFAWKQCKLTPGCATPLNAMQHINAQISSSPAYAQTLSDWVPFTDGAVSPEDLALSFESDPAAMALLNAYKVGWNAGAYGAVPPNGVFFDFARTMCGQVTGCAGPYDAMMHAVQLLRRDIMYANILAAWTDIRGATGWGTCTIGGDCYSGLIDHEMMQLMWTAATAPANLISTASLLAGMLGQAQPGDPHHGMSLVTALRELPSTQSYVSRGLIAVMLVNEASRIATMQRNGEELSEVQEAFAAQVAARMLAQARVALNQVSNDFEQFQVDNRPPLGWQYYLGTAPTDAHKRALVALIPNTTPSAAVNGISTTTGRLLTAIGISQRNQASNSTEVNNAIIAGVGVGVPLVSAVASVGFATATFSVTLGVGAAAVSASAGSATVLGLSGGLAATGVSGGVIAAAATGPAIIVVAAVAVLGAGIATVAQVEEFRNTIDAFDLIITLYQTHPIALGALTNPAGLGIWGIGSQAQLQFAIINLVAAGGFQL